MSPTLTATAAGETATVAYSFLPNYPSVQFSSLVKGATFADTLSAVKFLSNVVGIPATGIYQLNDFLQGGAAYALYSANVVSLVGASETARPIIRLNKNSSTQGAKVGDQNAKPTQTNPLYLLRLASNGSTHLPVCLQNLILQGTPQPPSALNEGQPHNYGGIHVYYTQGALLNNLLLQGASVGNWNSPPGETFSINLYRDVDTRVTNVEVDGRDIEGNRVGGAGLGGNNSIRAVIEDSWFHHSRVSSVTFSYTGNLTDATASVSPTIRRCLIEHNANTVMATGKRFTVVNYEGVLGTMTIEDSTLSTDEKTEWVSSHVSIGNNLASGASAVLNIRDVTPVGGHPNYNGALIIQCQKKWNGVTNTQKLSNIHVYRGGVELTQVVVTSAPSGKINIDPTKQYIVLND